MEPKKSPRNEEENVIFHPISMSLRVRHVIFRGCIYTMSPQNHEKLRFWPPKNQVIYHTNLHWFHCSLRLRPGAQGLCILSTVQRRIFVRGTTCWTGPRGFTGRWRTFSPVCHGKYTCSTVFLYGICG